MKGPTPEANQLLLEGTLALARCEATGIKIDTEYLDKTLEGVARRMERIEERLKQDDVWALWKKRHHNAKLGSGEQLADVLFTAMKLSSAGYTAGSEGKDKKRHKTDVDALAKVDHPFVKQYLKLKKLEKLHGTYLKGVRREVVNGRIHPSFSLNTVRTLRSSSSSPNFQNLPIRDPKIGKLIRTSFIPDNDDCVLVENDFKGAEVKVGVAYHHDENMTKYLTSPTADMHKDSAVPMFFLGDVKQVTKDIKNAIKGDFVFAEFYGSYFANVAKNLWVSSAKLTSTNGTPVRQLLAENGICTAEQFEKHVQREEERLWTKTFPGYAAWKKKFYTDFLKRGYFQMLSGFVIQGWSGERILLTKNEVTNYPIQGASFHCLLWVLIQLQKELIKRKMKARPVGQIHDSILANVPRKELQDYLHLVKDITERRLTKHWPWLTVPMIIEAEVAEESWHGKVAWEECDGIWQPSNN